MKLAVKKDQGSVPFGGFHYMLHIEALSDLEAGFFKQMGYIILDVSNDDGERLLKQARAALMHQCEIAVLAEAVT